MGLPNCSRCFGIADGELERRRRQPHAQRAAEDRRVAPPPRPRRRSRRPGSPAGSRSTRHSGVSGSSERSTGTASRAAGSTTQMPSSLDDHEGAERTEVLDQDRPGAPLAGTAGAAPPPTTTLPSAAPADDPAAARCVATSGPGTSARPSSSNTTAAAAVPSAEASDRPRAPGARTRRRRRARTTPTRSIGDGACPRRRGPARAGSGPAHSRRIPSASATSSSESSKSIGPSLALRAGRGSARRRCCAGSATCPAAMVREKLLHPRARRSRRCPTARSGPPRRRRRSSPNTSPAATGEVHAELRDPLAQLRERQLEDAAADPGHPGARRLGDVAPRQRPQGVELGTDVADPAAHRRLVPGARAARQWRASLAQQLHRLEQLAHERRAALEAQGDHRDAPPVVLRHRPGWRPAPGPRRGTARRTRSTRRWSAAAGSRCRGGPSAWISHVMPRWRLSSGPVRTSSSQKSATSACDVQIFEPVTTYSSPSRTARVRSDGQVAPGAGLGEPLAPDLVTAQDRGQEPGSAARRVPFDDHRRPGMEQPDEVHPDVGRVGPLELLEVDQLLDRARAAPAALDGPVDAGVPGVEQHALPRRVVGPARRASRSATASGRASAAPSASQARSSARKASSVSEIAKVHACGPGRYGARWSSPNSLMALPRTIL